MALVIKYFYLKAAFLDKSSEYIMYQKPAFSGSISESIVSVAEYKIVLHNHPT